MRKLVISRRAVSAGILASALLALSISSAQAATPKPLPPAVVTSGTSNVTYSSAILYGFIAARGQITSYVFQYGPTSAYGAQSPLAPAGNGTITIKVSQAVTGLRPFTTYHYRIVAVSPGGRTNGADHTFTTPKVPLSLAIVGTPNPVVFGDPFLVEGNLFGTGASTHEIVLQINPFPFLGGFKNVGNPEITNATGGFSFPVLGLLENAQLRVVTVGKPLVYSPVVTETVAVRVSFHVRRAAKRGYVRFFGTVAPAEVGAQVGFQLLQPGKSINEGGTIVKPGTSGVGSFSGRMRLRHHGLYRALVKVSDGAHVSDYSEPILVR
jgi:hypothetical protein